MAGYSAGASMEIGPGAMGASGSEREGEPLSGVGPFPAVLTGTPAGRGAADAVGSAPDCFRRSAEAFAAITPSGRGAFRPPLPPFNARFRAALRPAIESLLPLFGGNREHTGQITRYELISGEPGAVTDGAPYLQFV
jgi:hypothetical protein